MPVKEKSRRILLEELRRDTEEVGKQKMFLLGTRLKIAGLEREIRHLKEKLELF